MTRHHLHGRGFWRHQTPPPQERALMSPDTSSMGEGSDVTRHQFHPRALTSPDTSSMREGSDVTTCHLHRRGLWRHQTPPPPERALVSPDTNSMGEGSGVTRHQLCRRGLWHHHTNSVGEDFNRNVNLVGEPGTSGVSLTASQHSLYSGLRHMHSYTTILDDQ